jgi:hypothetical protein
MTMGELRKRKHHINIEIEKLNLDSVWIRSNWPVISPRGQTSIDRKLFSEALEGGLEAKCDAKRTGFFEAETSHAWFYFHIAHKLGRIYLVAALVR